VCFCNQQHDRHPKCFKCHGSHSFYSLSGTIKLNISRLVIKSALSAGAGSECVIDACVHEAEEEFRLGAMVLKSGNSSITGDASEALTYIILKMLNDAASAGYHLANTQPLKHCDAIATVAAATAVYRQVFVIHVQSSEEEIPRNNA
jgi:hypothetical protein